MLSVILFRRWETCAACDAVIAAETRGWSPIPENLRPGRQWGEVTWWVSKDELRSRDQGKERVSRLRRGVGKTQTCVTACCVQRAEGTCSGMRGSARKQPKTRRRGQEPALETSWAEREGHRQAMGATQTCRGFPAGPNGSLPAMQEMRVRPLAQEDPWWRGRQPTPVFLPGKFHGRGAWQATVHVVAKRQTWLSGKHFTFFFSKVFWAGEWDDKTVLWEKSVLIERI